MPPPSSFPLLLLLLLLRAEVRSYEAPEDKEDVFARRACPAFLTFNNAVFVSGATVELPCHCKPERVQSIVWFFRKHLDDSKETRALTDDHGNALLDPGDVLHSGSLRSRFSIRLFSLLIFRAAPDDSGVYICGTAHRDFFYGYDLDIQEVRTLSFAARLTTDATSQITRERIDSASPPYRIFTGLKPWSVCDRCGVPGEQIRVGLCYVHSHFLHVRYRRVNQTVASCGSGALPRALGRLTKGGAKLEVKSCQTTCPSGAPPSSKVLALKKFFGYNPASLALDLPVFYLNHPVDHILTLRCPGAQPHMAVAWDRGSEPIYRSQLWAGGGLGSAALQIDSGHHLVFNPARRQDSGVYYCWLQGQPAAEIRLLVYAHLGRGLSVTSDPDFPAAVQTVLTSFAIMTTVFCLLVLGRARVEHLRESGEKHTD